jgi:hypothetical protein
MRPPIIRNVARPRTLAEHFCGHHGFQQLGVGTGRGLGNFRGQAQVEDWSGSPLGSMMGQSWPAATDDWGGTLELGTVHDSGIRWSRGRSPDIRMSEPLGKTSKGRPRRTTQQDLSESLMESTSTRPVLHRRTGRGRDFGHLLQTLLRRPELTTLSCQSGGMQPPRTPRTASITRFHACGELAASSCFSSPGFKLLTTTTTSAFPGPGLGMENGFHAQEGSWRRGGRDNRRRMSDNQITHSYDVTRKSSKPRTQLPLAKTPDGIRPKTRRRRRESLEGMPAFLVGNS